jgi:PAS domain S-box-containing protein
MSGQRSEWHDLTADQYRALIERTSDVVTVLDADGTIKYQSPSSERVKGWSPSELEGESILDYVHPEDRSRVAEQFSSLTEEAGVIDDEIEFRFRTKDRGWIWLAVTGTAPGPGSPIDGYITVSREITERKAYEQRLELQRDNLELLNQMVRHDIRNDLQIVSAYAETLEAYVDDGGGTYLTKILEATHDAVEITETARDVTDVMLRSEADLRPVGLRTALEEEIDDTRASYGEALVRVEGSIPGVRVRADEMLGSVFRNLLSNAIQHNDTEIPKVTVSASVDDGTALVEVADNGPGIPDDRKAEIFEEGQKDLGSTGTGLGLYLVETLVERYGGEVHVEDNEPEGAVFVVELPVVE